MTMKEGRKEGRKGGGEEGRREGRRHKKLRGNKFIQPFFPPRLSFGAKFHLRVGEQGNERCPEICRKTPNCSFSFLPLLSRKSTDVNLSSVNMWANLLSILTFWLFFPIFLKRGSDWMCEKRGSFSFVIGLIEGLLDYFELYVCAVWGKLSLKWILKTNCNVKCNNLLNSL